MRGKWCGYDAAFFDFSLPFLLLEPLVERHITVVARDLLHIAAVVVHNDAFRADEQRAANHGAGRHLERFRLVHLAVDQQSFDSDVVVVAVAVRL